MECGSPDLQGCTVWCYGREEEHPPAEYKRDYSGFGGSILKGSGFYRNDKDK